MFDLHTFVADCRAAAAEDKTHRAALEIMQGAFHDPAAVLAAMGEPKTPTIEPIYRSDTLTIVNIVWGPHQSIVPHNHDMWAVIGIYTGQEDNTFWKRTKADPNVIEAAGTRTLETGDVTPLGKDLIHSVVNPLDRCTGAIHVYGGDFFAHPRSEWDAGDLTERPYNTDRLKAFFAN